jgi:hypothetical protein
MEIKSTGVQDKQAGTTDFRKIELGAGWLAIGLGVLGLGLVTAEAIGYPAETCAVWERGSCTTWTSTGPDLLVATLICAVLVTAPTVSLGAALLSRRRRADWLVIILGPLVVLVAVFLLVMSQFSDTTGLPPLAKWNWSSWGENMMQFSTMRAFSLSLVADVAAFIVAVAALVRRRGGQTGATQPH